MRDPRLAPIVADRLHHFDGQRDDLWSDVILLNHVHVLFTLRDGESLPDTLQGWKGVSSHLIHNTSFSAIIPVLHLQQPMSEASIMSFRFDITKATEVACDLIRREGGGDEHHEADQAGDGVG